MAENFTSVDEFIDWLADETERCDKAVKKVRGSIRALKAQRNRALEEQLSSTEEKATSLVQDTLAVIKDVHNNSNLSRINENEEYLQVKASFKKVVRTLNLCMQDIQQLEVNIPYDGSVINNTPQQEDNEAQPIGGDDLHIQMVFDSEETDVDTQIDQENREDAMKLAQDTVVLRDLMQDTVDLIEEQGEQLKEVDEMVETAAETTEQAVKELEAARGHQKATQKIKIIIFSVIGCCVLVAIILLVLQFGTDTFSGPTDSDDGATTQSPVDTR